MNADTTETPETIAAIKGALAGRVFNFWSELELQDGVRFSLERGGLAFEREVSLTRSDRIDFVVGTVGIEVKTGGSLAALTRQLFRYAQCDRIGALLVVTSKHRLSCVPHEILGRPVHVINTGGAL